MNNIILLTSGNSTFGFYKYKLVYKINGVEVTDYGNDFKTVQQQVLRNPHRLSEFRYEEFVPTTEQVTRLQEVNALVLDPIFKKNCLPDIALYVEANVMFNKAGELSSLANKCKEDTVAWLVNILKPSVKALRDEVRYGGVPLFGTVIDTSQDAKISTLGYVLYIIMEKMVWDSANPDNPKPFPDETKQYNWKAKDNNFVLLTFPQICTLSKALISHEEGCFAAEKLMLDYLSTLSVGELVRFRQLASYDKTGNIVEQEVTTVAYEELKPVWDNCYAQALEILKARAGDL